MNKQNREQLKVILFFFNKYSCSDIGNIKVRPLGASHLIKSGPHKIEVE